MEGLTPMTRKELYLAAIGGEDVITPETPQTREELYLAAIAGEDVTPPETPQTREEYYLSQILEHGGGGVNIQSPADLQRIVAQGKARDYLHTGDVIIIPWTDNNPSTPVTYQYPFVVAHIGDCYDEDGVKHEDAVYLMAKYALPLTMVFDAAENNLVDLTEEPNALEGWNYYGKSGNDWTALSLSAGDPIPTTYDAVYKNILDMNAARYGYNRWKDSAYRQWLNSGAAKNANWWTSQHTGDMAPSTTYTNRPGFLNGFGADWLAVLKKVKVDTAANTVTDGGVTDTTYDMFFLPSVEQMYGSPQASGVEGEYWEYWKDETGLTEPSNGSGSNTNDARKIPAVNAPAGAAVSCRLRSAYRGSSYSVWFVSTAGYLYYSSASAAYAALPACVIF